MVVYAPLLFLIFIASSTTHAEGVKESFKQVGQDFKKLGQDIGQAGKEVGKEATKVGHKVAEESKEVAATAKHTGKTIGQRASAAWGEFTTGVKNAWNRATGDSGSKKDDFD